MSTGITPQACFRPAIFYDPQSNPLNIPCEGPKVCPVTIDSSADNNFIIDFGQLFSQGQMSTMQSVGIDMSQTTGFGSTDNVGFICSGVNQQLVTRIGNAFAFSIFPLTVSAPPKIQFIIKSSTGRGNIYLYFYNYMVPVVSLIANAGGI